MKVLNYFSLDKVYHIMDTEKRGNVRNFVKLRLRNKPANILQVTVIDLRVPSQAHWPVS